MSNTSYSFKENSHVIVNQGGEKKVMKKILSVALSTAMAFSMFASVAFGADAKLTPEQQFNTLKEAGIVSGFPDGLSHLEKTLTRAELAKIIVNSMSLEPVDATSYNDKNYANHWGRTYIEAATQAGILNGKDAAKKLFDPNGAVTVQELAKVLVTALKLEVPADANNTASAWAKGYVAAAVEKGFLPEGINYQAQATRSQAVVAAYAIYETTQATKVKSYKVVDSKNIEFTLSNDEVVKVTLEKELEPNKETEVTFKTAAGEEIKTTVTWEVTAATKVEKVTADNLKEVVVAFDGSVTKEEAEKITNYKLGDNTLTAISSAKLNEDGKSVVINLQSAPKLENQKTYKLTVSNIAGVKSQTVEFTALDVTVPSVKGVSALGNKVISVNFSEPVDKTTAENRVNYKLNGFVVNGEIKLSSDLKTATITLYSRMSSGDNKLTVTGVKDYAGMTIINYLDQAFSVVEDKTAPASFEIVSATLDAATIKFNEAIDKDSVDKANFYWADTTTAKHAASNVYPSDSTFTTWVVEFTGSDKLPARETTLYTDKIQDLSGNSVASLNAKVNATVDVTRPEIKNLDFGKDSAGNYLTGNKVLELSFNKKVDLGQFTGSNAENITVKDSDNKVVAIGAAAAYKVVNSITDYNTVLVTLSNSLKDDTSYTVEVKNVVDATALNNKMIPQTFTVKAPLVTAPTVGTVSVQYNSIDGTSIMVPFSNEMTLNGEYSIVKSDRYMIQIGSNWYLLPSESSLAPTYDNKGVIIRIPADAKYDGANTITAASQVKGVKVTLVADKNGNKISGLTVEKTGAGISLAAAALLGGDDAPVATANDTVKVTFDRPLAFVDRNDFRINSTITPESATYQTVGGKGVVTLKLSSDTKFTGDTGVAVTTVASPASKDLLGASITGGLSASIVDKIAPSLVATNPVQITAKNQITLTFDEPLQDAFAGANAQAVASSFVVTYGLNNDKLVAGSDYTAAIGTAPADNTVVITITKAAELTNVKVASNDSLMYVFDKAAVSVANSNKVSFEAKTATLATGVSGIDTKGPEVAGVTNLGVYNANVTPTFDGTATLAKDGGAPATFATGTAITVDGSYVLVATDAASNTTTVNFVVDKTAATVTTKLSAAGTFTATGTQTLVFSEELSAASKATVKAAVDAAYVVNGTATVSSAWGTGASANTLTVTLGGTMDATNTVVSSAIPAQTVTDLAGNTSVALALQ
ncbi:S-layer homology domain-containing protein [Paenibacillus sp. DXFW5]|uniref:S-layer homology domain-containing protein n=1 Tax=Paenibacillus rhizolycopersici TaxID=2780073 RepID=A0ABS2HE44_9BACL|nr:S-layer homology domain-containing protein [Paenibacillus rhizolycopersici]MBM6998339.1 S-layer homology domain-containing protein [Paenibacillus rhizolycopersici]